MPDWTLTARPSGSAIGTWNDEESTAAELRDLIGKSIDRSDLYVEANDRGVRPWVCWMRDVRAAADLVAADYGRDDRTSTRVIRRDDGGWDWTKEEAGRETTSGTSSTREGAKDDARTSRGDPRAISGGGR